MVRALAAAVGLPWARAPPPSRRSVCGSMKLAISPCGIWETGGRSLKSRRRLLRPPVWHFSRCFERWRARITRPNFFHAFNRVPHSTVGLLFAKAEAAMSDDGGDANGDFEDGCAVALPAHPRLAVASTQADTPPPSAARYEQNMDDMHEVRTAPNPSDPAPNPPPLLISVPRSLSPLQEEENDGEAGEGEGEGGEGGEGADGPRAVVSTGEVTSGAGEGVAVPKSDRITTPYITKFERARVLGTRALQISMNAPVMVELEGETDPLQVHGMCVCMACTCAWRVHGVCMLCTAHSL